MFLTIRNPFGPIWTLLDRFKQELIFCSEAPLPTPTLSVWGKKSFLSKMAQKGPDGPKMGPKWSKTLRLTILVPFGPFWTTLECWQACHVWPFLVQNGPLLGQRWSGKTFMKIRCREVPKPTYLSLLWPAEWKAPAPLRKVNFGFLLHWYSCFILKHGRLVNTPKWSKRVRKGPKWPT